jgi:hypothetical protein
MSTRLAVAGLVILSVVACSDINAPARGVAPVTRSNDYSYDCGDPDNPCYLESRGLPPPPYSDTMYVAINEDGSRLSGASLIRVQYFINKTDNNGWMMFRAQTSSTVIASPSAKISLHKGTFSGKGTIDLIVPGGVVSVDLSKNLGRGTIFNSDCAKTCGTLVLTGAKFTLKDGTTSVFNGSFRMKTGEVVRGD